MDCSAWGVGVFGTRTADEAGGRGGVDETAHVRGRLIAAARSCVESVCVKEGGLAAPRSGVFAPVCGLETAQAELSGAANDGGQASACEEGRSCRELEENVLRALRHLLQVRFLEDTVDVLVRNRVRLPGTAAIGIATLSALPAEHPYVGRVQVREEVVGGGGKLASQRWKTVPSSPKEHNGAYRHARTSLMHVVKAGAVLEALCGHLAAERGVGGDVDFNDAAGSREDRHDDHDAEGAASRLEWIAERYLRAMEDRSLVAWALACM